MLFEMTVRIALINHTYVAVIVWPVEAVEKQHIWSVQQVGVFVGLGSVQKMTENQIQHPDGSHVWQSP